MLSIFLFDFDMFYFSIIKFKFLTILSMVLVGMFSRSVLSITLLPLSHPLFHSSSEKHQFPHSGSRSALRFFNGKRMAHRRRLTRKGKSSNSYITGAYRTKPK